MMKNLWRIITPIVSAVIGILAANSLNIFELFSFVPKDISYEICITAYFAIADVIVEAVKEWLSRIINEKLISRLNVVINVPGVSGDISTNAIMTFNSQDLSEAVVSVEIKGIKKHFKGLELIIKKPAFAEMQAISRRREVRIESDDYHIDLEALFGNSEKLECKQDFKVALIKDSVDGEASVTIYPELSKKKKCIIYKYNYTELRTVN